MWCRYVSSKTNCVGILETVRYRL
uniref:Uncharacterized protein n=1 Tax=Arundo donax TaxID=35708 RepID=A0A0A9B0T9_ARUDO